MTENKKLGVITVSLVVVAGLFLMSCGSDEAAKKSLSGTKENFASVSSGDQNGVNENTNNSVNSDGKNETEQEELDFHASGDPEIRPEVATRPPEMSSQEWWLLSGLFSWYFGDFDSSLGIKPEQMVQIWSDPNNSDVGSPEFASELVEAAKAKVVDHLTYVYPESEAHMNVFPPAENIVVNGAAAAKVYRLDGGPQLYRVAVLWSADKDRENQRPAFNQMIEVLFEGSPGNFRQVSCLDAYKGACKEAIFDLIL
jgi:hypothetical protein